MGGIAPVRNVCGPARVANLHSPSGLGYGHTPLEALRGLLLTIVESDPGAVIRSSSPWPHRFRERSHALCGPLGQGLRDRSLTRFRASWLAGREQCSGVREAGAEPVEERLVVAHPKAGA